MSFYCLKKKKNPFINSFYCRTSMSYSRNMVLTKKYIHSNAKKMK